MRDLRIVFMGTPDFAVGVLKKLLEEGKNIVGVVTAPDRPAGRGRKLKPSAVKEFALSKNLPVLQPTKLKEEAFLTQLKTLEANLQIVVAFRMLPKVVWNMPEYGTFNLHASLLPHYRGAAPINWAIMNQEKETGVTTFFIDEKIDTGAVILKEVVPISEIETAGTLHDTLMALGSELVVKTVSLIEAGQATAIAQNQDSILQEAPKLTSENTRINWNNTVEQIDAFIRGLSPYPVAWSVLKNDSETLKAKIYSASKESVAHNEKPGTITTDKKHVRVAAKNGYIYIKDMQLPGKRKMDIASLLNGFSFAKDAKLV
ncbi:methionyl-tRNA formyltransferase [Marixanthomonas spongiae]|uniref:Methionyl-tRNA formyltransferase n=1 Tax=Marixanthomonas spongiae TaxID=2174845 RepID=A0A2U0HYI9_9FLAO|nr:methionyl-tRNA formyltransferase [Marixanthomonas spongiae]PVW13933.1 methionyl-tRNA formyltransferase [Marixanthomonas spongiae]